MAELKALALDGLGGAERREQAIALAAEEVERARESGAPGAIGRALRVLGVLRRDDGIEHLREAVAVLETSQARLERAKALFALGACSGTPASRPRRATRCGARWSWRRHAGPGAGRGGPVGARRGRRAAAHHGDRRRRIADRQRAARQRPGRRGRTNKDIAQELYVTPKTVEVHLSNAYRKLGIRSRHELAEALG